MNGRLFFSVLGFLYFICANVGLALTLNQTPDLKHFQQLFNAWTQAFNQKKLSESCELFSPNLSADYQGAAPKNFASICSGFKKIFQDKTKEYTYHFKIRQIYREANLAAVRITWFLTIKNKQDGSQTIVKDEGLDILSKNRKSEWKIIQYLAYPAENK